MPGDRLPIIRIASGEELKLLRVFIDFQRSSASITTAGCPCIMAGYLSTDFKTTELLRDSSDGQLSSCVLVGKEEPTAAFVSVLDGLADRSRKTAELMARERISMKLMESLGGRGRGGGKVRRSPAEKVTDVFHDTFLANCLTLEEQSSSREGQ